MIVGAWILVACLEIHCEVVRVRVENQLIIINNNNNKSCSMFFMFYFRLFVHVFVARTVHVF